MRASTAWTTRRVSAAARRPRAVSFTTFARASPGSGTKVLELTRPAKFIKSTVIVKDGTGVDAGKIVQQNAIGKIRFALQDAQGSVIGSINAEN